MGVSGFASSGVNKAASTLRSAARTPKHRRSSDALPENPSQLQTPAPNGLPLGTISAEAAADFITKYGRLGKVLGVPALAGRDRLKAGLHTKDPRLPAKQKRHVCRATTGRCVWRRVESVALRQTGAASSGAMNSRRASVRWTRTGLSQRGNHHPF